MTVGAGYAPAVYAGDGSAHTFSFTWPLLSADHLVVTKTSGAVIQPLVRNIDYLLTWVGPGATGSVRLIYMDGGTPVNDPPGVGETVTISRNVPISQETDLRRGPFFPEVVEKALDKAAQIDQQQQTAINDHAARLAELEEATELLAPGAADFDLIVVDPITATVVVDVDNATVVHSEPDP